jgi:hypothetical protein
MGPESCALMPTLRGILVSGSEEGLLARRRFSPRFGCPRRWRNLLDRRTIVCWRPEQQTASQRYLRYLI